MLLNVEQTHDPLDVTPKLIVGHRTTFEKTCLFCIDSRSCLCNQIANFVCFTCNLNIGAVYGDEVGTYLKVWNWLVVVNGDVLWSSSMTRVSLTLSSFIFSCSLVFSIPLCFKDFYLFIYFFQRHVVMQKWSFFSIFGCCFQPKVCT